MVLAFTTHTPGGHRSEAPVGHHRTPLGTPWDHLGPLGTTWDHLGLLGTTWDYGELRRTSGTYGELSDVCLVPGENQVIGEKPGHWGKTRSLGESSVLGGKST